MESLRKAVGVIETNISDTCFASVKDDKSCS